MKTKFKAFFVFLCLNGFLAFSQSGHTDSLLPLKQRWISAASPKQKISALQAIITGYSQNLSQKDSLFHYCNTYINYAREIKSDTTLMRAYLARLKAFRFHSDWISLINSGKEALRRNGLRLYFFTGSGNRKYLIGCPYC
jgi:hypothetical protein